jgi:hypothetical protein
VYVPPRLATRSIARTTSSCRCNWSTCQTRSSSGWRWSRRLPKLGSGGVQDDQEPSAAVGPDPLVRHIWESWPRSAAEPVGWCACGRRSRYVATATTRSKIMRIVHAMKTRSRAPTLPLRAGRASWPGGDTCAHACGGRAGSLRRCLRNRRLASGRIRTALSDAFLGPQQVFEDRVSTASNGRVPNV